MAQFFSIFSLAFEGLEMNVSLGAGRINCSGTHSVRGHDWWSYWNSLHCHRGDFWQGYLSGAGMTRFKLMDNDGMVKIGSCLGCNTSSISFNPGWEQHDSAIDGCTWHHLGSAGVDAASLGRALHSWKLAAQLQSKRESISISVYP